MNAGNKDERNRSEKPKTPTLTLSLAPMILEYELAENALVDKPVATLAKTAFLTKSLLVVIFFILRFDHLIIKKLPTYPFYKLQFFDFNIFKTDKITMIL